MTLELYDEATFDGTIADAATEQLEVKTAAANHVQVLIDDGTTGNDPSQYTVTQEYYVPEFDDYMEYSEQTAQTAIAIRTEARGAKLRFTFENTSGGNDTYRIVITSYREMN